MRTTSAVVMLCSLLQFLTGATPLSAQEYLPDLAPASGEGELAISGFRTPEGMEVKLFAAEPDVANIAAFGLDEQGRVFVCETYRQEKGVVDNRGHMDWLLDDLSLQSVDDRRAMFEKYLGPAVSEYAIHHDRIRLLEDTNSDGRADVSTVFADGFHDVVTGTGAGILARQGDVYYTNIPDLWLLRDTTGDGVADERRALSSGYGVRVAFRGHDLHGLVMGPDGRLYFSIGDRGFNIKTPEGKHLHRPDTGAVFRCNPDGSQLEVYASGLRNPQELAFDDYGNLWTVDNNSDSGDQARLVCVAEGGDSGWRMYFQYLEDRGPWNRERMWYPYRSDDETTTQQPAYIVPPIVNLSDGPSGLVAYPGVGLPERYRGHFFLADFRGTAGQSGIRSFAVEPDRATYRVTDSHEFIWSILATDVDFSFDGRMFVSDWVDGWTGTGKGRLYTFQDPVHAGDASVLQAAALMQQGLNRQTSADLVELLSHPDRRIRQEAQFALVNRAEAGTLAEVAASSTNEFARLHAVWGLGQLARVIPRQDRSLVRLLSHEDAEVVAQTARVLGDLRTESAVPELTRLVAEGTARQQYFAAIALGRLGASAAVSTLVQLLADNADDDPYLRHAAVMGLAGSANSETLSELASHESPAVRLGAVVALRRLRDPAISLFLADEAAAVRDEASRAIHDLPIDAALIEMAAAPLDEQTDAFQRRVINANFRLGGGDEAERLVAWANDDTLPVERRLAILDDLLAWREPPVLDRVTNEFRRIEGSRSDALQSALAAVLPNLLTGPPELRAPAVKLAAEYHVQEVTDTIRQLATVEESSPHLRAESLLALQELQVDDLAALAESGLADTSPRVRSVARRLLISTDPERGLQEMARVLEEGETEERQQALALLTTIDHPSVDQLLGLWLGRLAEGGVPAGVQLDLVEAAAQRISPEIQEKLSALEKASDTSEPLHAFRMTLEGGDAERGREIFFGRASASCRRCHVVNGEGSAVGPDLSGVARDQPREYLLESIVNPNAKIAKGFDTNVCLMDDGRIYSGIIKEESETTLKLMQPTGEIVVVPVDQIEQRAQGKSGMPEDLAKSLSKREIRDLVEYLSTLKVPAATSSTEHR